MKIIKEWERMLAQSEHYYVIGSYEEVVLYRKEGDVFVSSIGHHYKYPAAAMIDKDEKYCISVGSGVIVYKLKDPFKIYQYNEKTDQWYEFGRGPENVDWIKDVVQVSDFEVELTDENDQKRLMKVIL